MTLLFSIFNSFIFFFEMYTIQLDQILSLEFNLFSFKILGLKTYFNLFYIVAQFTFFEYI